MNALERYEDGDGHSRRHANATLATDYAALWSRFVMSDLQSAILSVVRARSEAR